ncbi:hypothetical protein SBA3_20030 [Candidatus Sulfopaludibacter sp. SbA3]|nr:hypothetical protein SBA3_20030 [Candidatus Sulfopaludibacter sp. SbA3]
MRFAVDAHAIGRHLTGNEVYVRSLLNAFAALDPDCEFVAYISEDSARASVPARIRTRTIAANPFLRLGLDLARRVREDNPGLLHVQYTAPVGCRVPVVVSVHDVSFLEHPEYFTRDRAWQLQWTVRRTVKRAAKILTGSEFSRNAILKVYGDLEEDKVVVVPNAAASEFRPLAREAASAAVRERFRIGSPFILSVGDIQPRKNQIGLIRAFSKLVAAYPQLKHDLVLVGKETWFADRVREAARESGRDLVCGPCARGGKGVGRRGAHSILRFCVGQRPAAVLQCLRPVRIPIFLRRFRAARAGGDGLRAGGGLLQHVGFAGGGGWCRNPV